MRLIIYTISLLILSGCYTTEPTPSIADDTNQTTHKPTKKIAKKIVKKPIEKLPPRVCQSYIAPPPDDPTLTKFNAKMKPN